MEMIVFLSSFELNFNSNFLFAYTCRSIGPSHRSIDLIDSSDVILFPSTHLEYCRLCNLVRSGCMHTHQVFSGARSRGGCSIFDFRDRLVGLRL